MSFLSPGEPTPELSTTRTGGRSARLIAVVVVAVLVSVVYIGVSQREPTPVQQPTRPAVAVASTPTPTAAPSTTTLPTRGGPPYRPPALEYSGAETIAQRRGAIPSAGDLRVTLDVGGHRSDALLAEVTPGHLHAAYRVPLPAPNGAATLELFEPAPYAPPVQYGVWNVPLNMTAVGQQVDVDVGAYAPSIIVSDRQPPDPSAEPGRSVVVRNGYLMQISGARIGNGATVIVDLEVGAKPTYPVETYSLVLRAAGQDYRSDPSSVIASPGYARGKIDLTNDPNRLQALQATVTLFAGAPDGGTRSQHVVGTYTIALPETSDYTPPWFVASPVAKAKPGLTIESSGYTLSLVIAPEGKGHEVFWTVTVNPRAATK